MQANEKFSWKSIKHARPLLKSTSFHKLGTKPVASDVLCTKYHLQFVVLAKHNRTKAVLVWKSRNYASWEIFNQVVSEENEVLETPA